MQAVLKVVGHEMPNNPNSQSLVLVAAAWRLPGKELLAVAKDVGDGSGPHQLAQPKA